MFCLGCKTISRLVASRLVVLRPEQDMESELKLHTCLARSQKNFAGRQLKGQLQQSLSINLVSSRLIHPISESGN